MNLLWITGSSSLIFLAIIGNILGLSIIGFALAKYFKSKKLVEVPVEINENE